MSAHANGKPIHRPVETAYIHCDISDYGRGAVLNGHLEARCFWGPEDERRQNIIGKELKAVPLTIVLAGLTSRFPEMMAELRRLWYMLDSSGIHVRARYIRSADNVWADCMSRRMHNDDSQLDPVLFAELETEWGKISIPATASRRP
eukprot:jgi/Tetstr1/459965/TSEL_005289.t1